MMARTIGSRSRGPAHEVPSVASQGFLRYRRGLTRSVRGWLPLFLLAGAARAGQVEFRSPRAVSYEIATVQVAKATSGPKWLAAIPVGGGKPVRIGDRVVLRLTDTNQLAALCAAHGLVPSGTFDDRTYLLQATDAAAAVHASGAMSRLPGVEAAVPVMQRQARKHFPFAPAPGDPLFAEQAYLDAVVPDGTVPLPSAPDIAVRGAWAVTRGRGVTVAVVDDGVDLAHADLSPNGVGPHKNFVDPAGTGSQSGPFQYHGTSVAGLIAARGGNHIGLSGTAPLAGLASWVIFDTLDNLPDEVGMAAMFSHANDTVAVQNHSWGNSDFDVLEMGLAEALSVSNAVTAGRGGLGVVMVRSAGNTRDQDYNFRSGVGDANQDGYANDPRQIAVGAVGASGRVASYSTPGACVLVAAMGGDQRDGSPGLLTTDPSGTSGLNRSSGTAGDYATGATALVGTSASAPLVSGIAALMLSANPRLGWRDVQQVLALSSRHIDLTDPDLGTNGAGFRVSHNVGFGVPDAGAAVRLALAWSNRPPAVELRFTNALPQAIPDDGLRVFVTGTGVPASLSSLPASGSVGIHPDIPTASLRLVDVGQAISAPGKDFTGAGMLMTRKPGTYVEKISFAAGAGAAFAVIVNNEGTDQRTIMRDTGFVAIPAVLLGHDNGEVLRAQVATNAAVRVSLGLDPARFVFQVAEGMVVEHVQVRLHWRHPRMSDLRVTLRSPAGTTSILHRPGGSASAAPDGWAYSSVHHLGEASTGTWILSVTDEATGMTGTVDSVELVLHGVPITDVDADGLDDAWELARFGSLAMGPRDDPDHDGQDNAAEQLAGSDPMSSGTPFRIGSTELSPGRVRLSWPATTDAIYEVLRRGAVDSPETIVGQVPGRFPEAGLVVPSDAAGAFFRVRAK